MWRSADGNRTDSSVSTGISSSSPLVGQPKLLPPILRSDNGPAQNVLMCTMCCEIPLDPVITPVCQHVFCRPCIEQALENKEECPNDRQHLDPTQLRDISGALRRIWEHVPVRCPKDQCNWEGTMGIYAGHAQKCVSSLEEKYESRIQELKDAHAEEMNAKLAALREQYEKNFDRTLDRIQQLHAHDMKEAVEMVRLQCEKDNEQKIQELRHETSSAPPVGTGTGNSYDGSDILRMVQLIAQNLNNPPIDINRDQLFQRIRNVVMRNTTPVHLCELRNVCMAAKWFTKNQRATFGRWHEGRRW